VFQAICAAFPWGLWLSIPVGGMICAISREALPRYLVWAGPIFAASPAIITVAGLALARAQGFEVVGESGAVRYRGGALPRPNDESPDHDWKVYNRAKSFSGLGALPWMLFFTVPAGLVAFLLGFGVKALAWLL
jgi:hypothetical protein